MTIKIGRAAVGHYFTRHRTSGAKEPMEGDEAHVYEVMGYVPPGVSFKGVKHPFGRYVAKSYHDGDPIAFSSAYYLRGAKYYQRWNS